MQLATAGVLLSGRDSKPSSRFSRRQDSWVLPNLAGTGYQLDPFMQSEIEGSLKLPLLELLNRGGKNIRSNLVRFGVLLAGGNPDNKELSSSSQKIARAVELLHLGSLIIDDIQDDSMMRRGAPSFHTEFGVGHGIGFGNWLYFLPHRLIDQADLLPEISNNLHSLFYTTLERGHIGQVLDNRLRIETMKRTDIIGSFEQIAKLKTGVLTELAMVSGYLVASNEGSKIDHIGDLGRRFGVVLQMLDDIGNALNADNADKHCEDLLAGRCGFVWSYAARVLSDDGFDCFRRQIFRPQTTPQEVVAVITQYGLAEAMIMQASAKVAELENEVALASMGEAEESLILFRSMIAKLRDGYGISKYHQAQGAESRGEVSLG